MSVERTEERKVSSIETHFVGPLQEVLNAIAEEMKRYDPRGYGTNVQKIIWHPGGNGELQVQAHLWRSKSCD